MLGGNCDCRCGILYAPMLGGGFCGIGKSSGMLCRTDCYSRINNTKSPASGAGNVREPRLMSPSRESARSRVRVGQCVSAV